ncbi:hypothetical protein HBNXNv_1043 [Candidatus Nanohalovita haloferacivicina]|nr:hypothetical protein HBNXNv_1043 [Candidatus Nanohalobia archaeon BNXNv]
MNWNSTPAKVLAVVGALVSLLAAFPYTRRTGEATWITPIVETGPELIGVHLVQGFLVVLGVSAFGLAVLIERGSK